jgi:signal transduction histidine kinase
MGDFSVRDRFRREAGLRARIPYLSRQRPLPPVPEITLLLDSQGRIVRASDIHAGDRLGELPYDEGRDVHSVFHRDCEGVNCSFLDNWMRAWTAHRSGLPIEWLYLSEDSNVVVKLRLEPVPYACGTLFEDMVDTYDAHSMLFIQDLSRPDREHGENAAEAHIRNAFLYERRRASDGDPDLVASLDERLRRVTRRLIDVQDEVRKQLAAELHDSLGQTLSLLRFEIESATNKYAASDDAAMLTRAGDYVRRAQRELRRISNELRTESADASGLSVSLQKLVADFRATKPGIDLTVDARQFEPNAPADLSVTIYRIVQEALNNIAQHSQATEALISLTTDDSGVRLQISDNGRGISNGSSERRGLGLITMRERAETIGGHFDLQSSADEGCTVCVSWPADVVRTLR